MAAWLGTRRRFMVAAYPDRYPAIHATPKPILKVLAGENMRPTPGSYYADTIAQSSLVELDMYGGDPAWRLDREETADLKFYAVGLLQGVPWVLEVLS